MTKSITNKTTKEVAEMLEAAFDTAAYPSISYILGSDWACGYDTSTPAKYYAEATAAFHRMYGYVA